MDAPIDPALVQHRAGQQDDADRRHRHRFADRSLRVPGHGRLEREHPAYAARARGPRANDGAARGLCDREYPQWLDRFCRARDLVGRDARRPRSGARLPAIGFLGDAGVPPGSNRAEHRRLSADFRNSLLWRFCRGRRRARRSALCRLTLRASALAPRAFDHCRRAGPRFRRSGPRRARHDHQFRQSPLSHLHLSDRAGDHRLHGLD